MDDTTIRSLRGRLCARLRQVIGAPSVEAKELAAFDLIMSRRQFLKAGQYTAIAGLIAAGVPPTLWGRKDVALAVDPADVGLTVADQSAATVATGLTVGTEVFDETIYAEPPPGLAELGKHAVIEGARGRARVLSEFGSGSGLEADFLDGGYHYGPAELVQLELNSDGTTLSLVHYRASGRRQAGVGMVGTDIFAGKSLSSAAQVLTVTSPSTNQFNPTETSSGVTLETGVHYAVVVIDEGTTSGYVCLGAGSVSIAPPYDTTDVPITWHVGDLADFNVPMSTFVGVDKYTDLSDPARPREYVVIYHAPGSTPGITVLTFDGNDALTTYEFDYPDAAASEDSQGTLTSDWRLIQLAAGSVTLAKSSWDDTSGQTFTSTAAWADLTSLPPTSSTMVGDVRRVRYGSPQYQTFEESVTTQSLGITPPMIKRVADVHDLYSATDSADRLYQVKLGRISGSSDLVLFTMGTDPTNSSSLSNVRFFGAYLPLALPTNAGAMVTLSGGISKYGGFRFMASDESGNLFMLRQRRATATDSPYAPPIYAQNTSSGQPVTIPYTDKREDTLPSNTAGQSIAETLSPWVQVTQGSGGHEGYFSSFNILANAVLAFATDDNSVSQAVWLGTGFKGVYAPPRFGHDSAHIEIKAAGSSTTSDEGSPTTSVAYLAIADPVTKGWHTREIARQVEPQAPGLNQSGDHYQATIAGANSYGRLVSLASTENANLAIEVRADVPTMVVDDTHDQYYDVARDTSFMTTADAATGRLEVVVKAETFAQVLYARLVDTSKLQPSNADTAMLSSTTTDANANDWVPINMAAQAQQRMGNDGSTTIVDALGTAAPLVDTTAYITSTTLGKSSQASSTSPGWDFKGNYTASSDNLGSLATYLNTSGQNLIAATPQLGQGGSADDSINPLTAVTAVTADTLIANTNATAFYYKNGAISPSQAATPSTNQSDGGQELGSIWSGISHALHDALHWLQNVTDEVYNDLASATAVTVEMADSINCTVDGEIMKAVNGVDQAVTYAVSTVEEYANVLANLVVTIVEQSFLFRMIEELIALISLFIHLVDVLHLSTSMQSMMCNILGGTTCDDASYAGYAPPTVPQNYSTWRTVGQYFGANSSVASEFAAAGNAIDSGQVTGLVDDISGNPFTKKILNAIMTAVGDAAKEAASALPLEFNVGDFESAATTLAQDLGDLTEVIATGMTDAAENLITTLLADLIDPDQLYADLTSAQGLEAIAQQIGTDIRNAFDVMDAYAQPSGSAPPPYAGVLQSMLGQDGLLTVNLQELADLLQLFGVGTADGGKVGVSGDDAIFFPLAVVTWVAVYMRDGKSIDNIDAIFPPTSTAGAPEGVSTETAELAHLAVNTILTELGAASWAVGAIVRNTSEPATAGEELISAAGAYLGMLRWLNEVWYLVYAEETGAIPDPKPYQVAWTVSRSVLAAAALVSLWLGKQLDATAVKIITVALNLGMIIASLIDFADNGSKDLNGWLTIIGQELPRTQIFATFLFDIINQDGAADEVLPGFAALAMFLPYGFVLQEIVLGDTVTAPPPQDDRPGNDNAKRQGPPPGLPRRSHREDPPGQARRRRPNG